MVAQLGLVPTSLSVDRALSYPFRATNGRSAECGDTWVTFGRLDTCFLAVLVKTRLHPYGHSWGARDTLLGEGLGLGQVTESQVTAYVAEV